MSDNIDVTPGTGKTIAADDIGGVLHQLVKIAFGIDGSITRVSSANPLPVDTTGSTISFSAPQHIIADSGTITTVSAVTAITNALPAGTNVIGHVIVDSGSIVAAIGQTSSGTTLTANPLTVGGRAATAEPTAVSDGQVVNAMFTKHGKLVTVEALRERKATQKSTLSNTTSETTIVTAEVSIYHDLYGLILANSGATTTKVDIRDDTGGSIIATIEVPAGETRGYMLSASSGIPQTAVNKNWTAQCAAATTALEVTAFFVKSSL